MPSVHWLTVNPTLIRSSIATWAPPQMFSTMMIGRNRKLFSVLRCMKALRRSGVPRFSRDARGHPARNQSADMPNPRNGGSTTWRQPAPRRLSLTDENTIIVMNTLRVKRVSVPSCSGRSIPRQRAKAPTPKAMKV